MMNVVCFHFYDIHHFHSSDMLYVLLLSSRINSIWCENQSIVYYFNRNLYFVTLSSSSLIAAVLWLDIPMLIKTNNNNPKTILVNNGLNNDFPFSISMSKIDRNATCNRMFISIAIIIFFGYFILFLSLHKSHDKHLVVLSIFFFVGFIRNEQI